MRVRINDLNGAVLYNSEINDISAQINLESLADGIYSIIITYDGGAYVQKLIKIGQ